MGTVIVQITFMLISTTELIISKKIFYKSYKRTNSAEI